MHLDDEFTVRQRDAFRPIIGHQHAQLAVPVEDKTLCVLWLCRARHDPLAAFPLRDFPEHLGDGIPGQDREVKAQTQMVEANAGNRMPEQIRGLLVDRPVRCRLDLPFAGDHGRPALAEDCLHMRVAQEIQINANPLAAAFLRQNRVLRRPNEGLPRDRDVGRCNSDLIPELDGHALGTLVFRLVHWSLLE